MVEVKSLFQGITEIEKVQNEGKLAKKLYFRIEGFSYRSGQFLMVSLPEEVEDKKKRIACSIATSPTETEKDGLVGIAIRLSDETYSLKEPNFLALTEGMKIFVSGPFGNGVFDGKEVKSMVFFASGGGIIPVRSAMKYIYDKAPNARVTLFYTIRGYDEIMYEDDIKEMLKNPNFKGFITVVGLSGSIWKPSGNGITKDLILDNISGKEDLFYACGSTPFVKEIEKVLLNDLGIDRSAFRAEAWA